jgi:hypothetical protein
VESRGVAFCARMCCADDVCVWDHAACPTTTTTTTINHALAHGSAEAAQHAVATHLLFTLARLQFRSCDEHVAGVAAGQTCQAALILMRSGYAALILMRSRLAFWPQRRSEGKTVSAHAAHMHATHACGHSSCVLSFVFHSSHHTRHTPLTPLQTFTTHHTPQLALLKKRMGNGERHVPCARLSPNPHTAHPVGVIPIARSPPRDDHRERVSSHP